MKFNLEVLIRDVREARGRLEVEASAVVREIAALDDQRRRLAERRLRLEQDITALARAASTLEEIA